MLGLASLLFTGHQAKAMTVNTVETENNNKSITVSRKEKKQKSFLDPTPFIPNFDLNNSGFLSYTSPFFNPTRSQRVKNKLRRKWYK